MLITTPDAMRDYATHLASNHTHILLHGELSAGKTTFVQGFATGLGLNSNQVHSPTYAYMDIYQDTLLHIDMYRVESPDKLQTAGILESIDTIPHVIIERPKHIDYYNNHPRLTIHIEKVDEQTRALTLTHM